MILVELYRIRFFLFISLAFLVFLVIYDRSTFIDEASKLAIVLNSIDLNINNSRRLGFFVSNEYWQEKYMWWLGFSLILCFSGIFSKDKEEGLSFFLQQAMSRHQVYTVKFYTILLVSFGLILLTTFVIHYLARQYNYSGILYFGVIASVKTSVVIVFSTISLIILTSLVTSRVTSILVCILCIVVLYRSTPPDINVAVSIPNYITNKTRSVNLFDTSNYIVEKMQFLRLVKPIGDYKYLNIECLDNTINYKQLFEVVKYNKCSNNKYIEVSRRTDNVINYICMKTNIDKKCLENILPKIFKDLRKYKMILKVSKNDIKIPDEIQTESSIVYEARRIYANLGNTSGEFINPPSSIRDKDVEIKSRTYSTGRDIYMFLSLLVLSFSIIIFRKKVF
mgnify:CR=1 FL=1